MYYFGIGLEEDIERAYQAHIQHEHKQRENERVVEVKSQQLEKQMERLRQIALDKLTDSPSYSIKIPEIPLPRAASDSSSSTFETAAQDDGQQ